MQFERILFSHFKHEFHAQFANVHFNACVQLFEFKIMSMKSSQVNKIILKQFERILFCASYMSFMHLPI